MRNTYDILKYFSEIFGASGCEARVGDAFLHEVAPFVDTVYTDSMGNAVAIKNGTTDKTIMIEAHCDTVGLMVKNVSDKGFLEFETVGGVDRRVLVGSRVYVCTSQGSVPGIIGAVPPHLKEKDDVLGRLCIDVGNAWENVSVGDYIWMKSNTAMMGEGLAVGCGFDNRAALTALLKTLILLEDYTPRTTIIVVASTSEELGMVGANVAAQSINPNFAICVDVCHGTTPDTGENTFAPGNVVLTTGPNICPKIFTLLEDTCKENNIPHLVDVDSGNTGTTAWAVQTVNRGIPCGLISIPLKYMHTSNEVVKISDINNCARLLAQGVSQWNI